jgi:hypothetical protein
MRHGNSGRISAIGGRVGSTGIRWLASGAIGLMAGTLGLMGIAVTTGTAGAVTTPAPVALPAVIATIPAALLGVSCATPVSCESVGEAFPTTGPSVPLTEGLTATSWKRQKSGNPSGGGFLDSVSCLTSGTFCQAVGLEVSGANLPLAEKWNGTHWSATPVPGPATGSNPALDGVSCTTTSSCVAVGSSSDSSGVHQVFSEIWNGVSWSLVAVPTPAGTIGALLDAVSCVGSPIICTAVGSYANSSSGGLLLVETWNGSSWTASTPALPPGAGSAQLFGVACPSSGTCVAVGTYYQGLNGFPLILSGSGSSWTSASTPHLPSGYGGELFSVSCGSSSICMSVGDKSNSNTGSLKTLAEVWNGATWSISAARTVKNAAASLHSVSCPSPTSCSAVGSDNSSSTGHYATLAEAWNGMKWVVQKTPRP